MNAKTVFNSCSKNHKFFTSLALTVAAVIGSSTSAQAVNSHLNDAARINSPATCQSKPESVQDDSYQPDGALLEEQRDFSSVAPHEEVVFISSNFRRYGPWPWCPWCPW